MRSRNMVITGPSCFAGRYMNSLVIGFGSTFLAVFLGTLAAFAFSRFKVPLTDDLMFFILSTRMTVRAPGRRPVLRCRGKTDRTRGRARCRTRDGEELCQLTAQPG